jgi:hypothetical protein
MSVFDNTVKIGRRVPDPLTDKALDSPGALSWGSITAVSALAGTTGVDCKLIHGDRWQQIAQNLTTVVMASETHSVMQNQTLTITQNRTKTVVGNVTATVVGSHNLLQVGAQNEIHVQPHNRLNCAPESQQEPTNKFRMFGIEFEVKSTESTITGTKLEINGIAMEVTGVSSAVIGMSVEMKGIDYCMSGLSVEPKLAEVELKALKTIGEGAEAKLAGGVAAAAPSVNAVPHVPTMGGT